MEGSPLVKGTSDEIVLHRRGYTLDRMLGEGSYAKVSFKLAGVMITIYIKIANIF